MNPLTPALRAVLALPAPVLDRIAGQPPEVDGHRLDPSVHTLLYLAGKINAERPHDVQLRRRDMAKNTALVMPAVRGVDVSDHLLAGRIPARVYRAKHRVGPAPVLMYLHGGGWVVGDLDSHDPSCRMLALHSGCVVVSVDYALAPEHPFPSGLDDARAAFEHIRANPAEFSAIPSAVAVAGDSAGANLAAALCLTGADPIALGLVYPATDLRMGQPSIDTFADGYFLTREDMFWYREQYLTDLAMVTDPLVSPLLADDLSAFPPTGVWTAGFDPLRDEGDAFARRLQEAGVDVVHECFDDQIHGFFGMGILPGGMDRITHVCRQLGRLVADALNTM